jgi:hypothetical protein
MRKIITETMTFLRNLVSGENYLFSQMMSVGSDAGWISIAPSKNFR